MKKTTAVLLAVLTAFLFCSCGNNQPKDIDIIALGGYVKNNVAFSEEIEEVDSSVALTNFGLDETEFEAVEYATSSAVAEVFAAFKGNSAEDTAVITEAVQNRIDYLRESYSSYGPQEVPKIESAVVITQGNCVIFCISADNSQAKALIEKYISQQ